MTSSDHQETLPRAHSELPFIPSEGECCLTLKVESLTEAYAVHLTTDHCLVERLMPDPGKLQLTLTSHVDCPDCLDFPTSWFDRVIYLRFGLFESTDHRLLVASLHYRTLRYFSSDHCIFPVRIVCHYVIVKSTLDLLVMILFVYPYSILIMVEVICCRLSSTSPAEEPMIVLAHVSVLLSSHLVHLFLFVWTLSLFCLLIAL